VAMKSLQNGGTSGRLLAVLGLSAVMSACAARVPYNVTAEPARTSTAAATVEPLEIDSLESFMAKVRRSSTQPRPERTAMPTAESTNPTLTGAIATAAATPSPASYRAAAREYARHGITDKAQEYLDGALRLDARDAQTYDAQARLWRDTGFPDVALGHAYRAVHFSRGSAPMRNTLGTVFQALGRHRDARSEYVRAVTRAPEAAYAWSNLCYAWMLERRPDLAAEACERALTIQPALLAAQNNLGLARALAGDPEGSARAFALGGDTHRAHYNIGMVQLAERRYDAAAESFRLAKGEPPSWREAARREQQSGRLTDGAQE
jgi:tetratricopeptide (TPR) repeat protein